MRQAAPWPSGAGPEAAGSGAALAVDRSEHDHSTGEGGERPLQHLQLLLGRRRLTGRRRRRVGATLDGDSVVLRELGAQRPAPRCRPQRGSGQCEFGDGRPRHPLLPADPGLVRQEQPVAVASLACGLSPTTGLLIAARAVQGVGGALMVPGSLSLISASLRRRAAGPGHRHLGVVRVADHRAGAGAGRGAGERRAMAGRVLHQPAAGRAGPGRPGLAGAGEPRPEQPAALDYRARPWRRWAWPG